MKYQNLTDEETKELEILIKESFPKYYEDSDNLYWALKKILNKYYWLNTMHEEVFYKINCIRKELTQIESNLK